MAYTTNYYRDTGGITFDFAGLFRGPVSFGFFAPDPVAPAAVAVATGVNPVETSYSLYGHPIPISVFGVGRIGGEIIAGPWVSGGLASFCISFGVPADPSGTRDIREIAFDSEVVWDTSGASGVTTLAGGTFRVEAFTARFYQGTLTQSVDPLETTHFGAEANAYRPQILLWFENLPLAGTKFGKIPYVSAVIGDGTGNDVNLGEAFERLAASPWVDFADFETIGVTDGVTDGGLILAQDYEFLQLMQQFNRFYPNWDLLQTDKLRIRDRGADLTPDIFLNKSNLIGVPTVGRAEPNSVPSTLELSTIDPGADYTIVPSRAQRPRVPVAVTTSVKTESAFLPIIMDSFTRAAVVTYTKYHEEATRKKINFTVMAYGLEIEPGDLVGIDLGEDFNNEVYRVVETTHGANYTVEVVAEAILRCDLGAGCDEYQEFIVRTSGLDSVHRDAYRDLICGLVTDGIWDKLDILRVYATQDSTTALLNLKSSSYTGTVHGSPTFTADLGFTGSDGSSTIYIDSGFNPSTAGGNYTQNSAHISAWFINTAAHDPPNGYSTGLGGGGLGTEAYVWPRYSVDGKSYCRINATDAGNPGTPAGYDGMFGGDRDDLNNIYYRNATNFFSGTPLSKPLLNLKFYELGYNNNGTANGSGSQQAMFSVGAHLSSAEWTSFYGRVRTYMTAVGVP